MRRSGSGKQSQIHIDMASVARVLGFTGWRSRDETARNRAPLSTPRIESRAPRRMRMIYFGSGDHKLRVGSGPSRWSFIPNSSSVARTRRPGHAGGLDHVHRRQEFVCQVVEGADAVSVGNAVAATACGEERGRGLVLEGRATEARTCGSAMRRWRRSRFVSPVDAPHPRAASGVRESIRVPRRPNAPRA
jgi:hypothetical protein